MHNFGSLALTFVGYFLVVALCLLCKCSCCCKRSRKFGKKLYKKLFYGALIDLIMESYLTMFVSCLINLQHLSWTSYGEIVQSASTIFFLAVLLVFPLVEIFYLGCIFGRIDEQEVQDRHGEFLADLNLRRGRLVLTQPAWFLLRRCVLAVVVVLLNEAALWQILILMATVLV